MLRGFRWQLLAFVFAVFLLGVALSERLTPNPAPTEVAAEPTSEPTATTAPTATPPPADNADDFTDADSSPIVGDVPTFREGLVGEVRRLNPLLRGLNPAEDAITALIFEGLVRTNEYGEPEPALATEWVISNDRTEYVFRLREDVLWHDGTPFTARDVDFTMRLLRSPDFPGDPEVGAFWQTVETEVLGDHLVRFRLTQPLGSFLDALRIGILPEHALRDTAAAALPAHPFNLTPVGTGPYQREAIRTAGSNRIAAVDLRVAPVFRQRPEGGTGYAVERVRFQVYPTFDEAVAAFGAGAVDGLASDASGQRPTLLGLPNANIHTKLEPTLGTLIFNWRRPEEDEPFNPFREERVRMALTHGLDRRSIVQRHLLNVAVPADNPLMPGSWAHAADVRVVGYDLQQAAALLEQANLPTETTDPEATEEVQVQQSSDAVLQFTVLVIEDSALVNVAQEMVGQWAQIGVEAQVEAVGADAYRGRLDEGAFDAAIVELSLGNSADPDVYSFWHQGQYPNGDNYGAVDDRRISETLERARRDPFGLNRVEHYRNFQVAFADRAVAIPLYYPLFTYVVSQRVDGVQLGFVGEPSDRLRNINEWTIVN